MKVVINAMIGGFSVRKAVFDALGLPWVEEWEEELITALAEDGITREEYEANTPTKRLYIARNDQRLIAAIEAIGVDAAGREPGALKIVEIPNGIAWHVHEDEGGTEWIAEDHRTWS